MMLKRCVQEFDNVVTYLVVLRQTRTVAFNVSNSTNPSILILLPL